MDDRQRTVIQERLHELDMLRRQRGLSEAEWQECGYLFTKLGKPDQAARCFEQAAARRRERNAWHAASVEPDVARKPRVILGLPLYRDDAELLHEQREAQRIATGLPRPEPILPEDIAIVVGIMLLVFFVFFFDTSVEVPKGDFMGVSYGGNRVNNLGLMQNRMVGIILGLAAVFGGLISKLVRASRTDPNQEP